MARDDGQRCDGKRTYKTEKAARLAARRMRRRVTDPFRLNHYRCERHAPGAQAMNGPVADVPAVVPE